MARSNKIIDKKETKRYNVIGEVSQMTGYEAFKQKREATGMTVRQFASAADISNSTLFYYESGTSSLYNMTVEKAVRIFSMIDTSIEDFFREYYSEDIFVSAQKAYDMWRYDNPYDLVYEHLKTKYRNRLLQNKNRKRISSGDYEKLIAIYNNTFSELSKGMPLHGSGRISVEDYRKYILHLEYCIRRDMEKGKGISNNRIAYGINDCLMKKGLEYQDLADILGVSSRIFFKYNKLPDGYLSMKVGTALKICQVLSAGFVFLFVHESDFD